MSACVGTGTSVARSTLLLPDTAAPIHQTIYNVTLLIFSNRSTGLKSIICYTSMARFFFCATALCTTASAFLLPTAPTSGSVLTGAVSTNRALLTPRVPLVWELQSTTQGQESDAAAVAPEGEEEDKDSLKGWQLAWEDVNTLPPEENSQTPLILRSTWDTSYLKDRFFILIRHKGEVKLVDSSCGRCSFPLLNGPIVQEPRLEEEDNTAISCKVCGLKHSIITGKAVKPKSGGLDLGQSMGNFFFKKGETKDIEVHPTRIMPDGKLYAKISPLKVK